jgi:hypothetical protein
MASVSAPALAIYHSLAAKHALITHNRPVALHFAAHKIRWQAIGGSGAPVQNLAAAACASVCGQFRLRSVVAEQRCTQKKLARAKSCLARKIVLCNLGPVGAFVTSLVGLA